MPSLLQERDQKVDRHIDVLSELFFSHISSADSGTHTEDLLQLELDGGSKFLDLISNLFVFTDGNGELTDLVQDVTEKSGDLLHEGFRSDKDIERLGPLLDGLLILVELLGGINIDATNTSSLSLVTMDGGTNQTNLIKVKRGVRRLEKR